jgi:hypothetical protein
MSTWHGPRFHKRREFLQNISALGAAGLAGGLNAVGWAAEPGTSTGPVQDRQPPSPAIPAADASPPPSSRGWPPEVLGDGHPLMKAPARWHPAAPREGVTVLWRCRFKLDKALEAGRRWWVTGSQRVRVWLDGLLLVDGPSRSDPWRWLARSAELPALAAGEHLLTAAVWHAGEASGVGQMGPPAFFLCAAEEPALDRLLGGAATWQCWHDTAPTPLEGSRMTLGTGERFQAGEHPWGWQSLDYDGRRWAKPRVVCNRAANPWGNLPLGCRLLVDPLPPMTRDPIAWQRLAWVKGVAETDARAWFAGQPLRIPPHTQCRLIVDRGGMTNAIPTLHWSGGAGATLGLVWSEGGYDPVAKRKRRRDQIGDRDELRGLRDELLPDGGRDRRWTPPWFRSFRYLQINVATAGEALELGRCEILANGFPLVRRAEMTGLDADGARNWEAAWETLRLCAHETFFDCPQYEQCQFDGDSPVQALCHYWLSGDDRLARKAIDDLHASQMAGGMLQCHYPARLVQILPTYSLYWIEFLDDFLRYRGDPGLVRCYLPAARAILEAFARDLRPDGLPGRVPHAPFVDWASGFAAGNAPQESDGGSAIVAGMLARAAAATARLEQAAGVHAFAPYWQQMAERLRQAIRDRCWNRSRSLVADTPARTSWSVHAQVEAVLAGAIRGEEARQALAASVDRPDVVQPGTFFYRYYLIRACRAAGDVQRIAPQYRRWSDVLARTGLTTFPEVEGEPRSDCHGWSSGIAISYIEDQMGLRPAIDAVGCNPLELATAPGTVPLKAALCTAGGTVRIAWGPVEDGRRRVEIETPLPVRVLATGATLPPGRHALSLPAGTDK